MATGGDSAQNPAQPTHPDYRLLQVSWAFWSYINGQQGKCTNLFTGKKMHLFPYHAILFIVNNEDFTKTGSG
jgi:hypothetical protein